MNERVEVADNPAAATSPSWRRHPKLDQWIAFWFVPGFLTLFGIVFVPLSFMMPPRSPGSSTPEIVGFMQSHNLLIACAILTLSFGLAPITNACYVMQVKRMSVSPAFRYTIIVGATTGAIVGMLPRARGDIVYDGRSIRQTSTDRIVRQGISLVPERRQLFGSMTVLENLLLGAFGIRDIDMPATPDRIFAIIREADRKAA